MQKGKLKWKLVALGLLAVLLITVFCGCSVDTETVIQEDGSGSITQTVLMEKEYLESEETDKGYVYEDVTIDGVEYRKGTKTVSFTKVSDIPKLLDNMKDCRISYDEKQFFLESKMDTYTAKGVSTGTDQIKGMLQISYSFTFPYEVVKTNGTIQPDQKTVVWDTDNMNENCCCWAVFSEDMLNQAISAPKLSGVKNKAYYKKAVTVKAVSDTVIASMKTNGVFISSNTCKIAEEGKYTVTCVDVNGKSAKVSFVIDKTNPTVKGVAKGKTYTLARTIKFSDKYGIKKATLNGKKISFGKKISKKGSYTLVVTDKAGNRTVVKFKIK